MDLVTTPQSNVTASARGPSGLVPRLTNEDLDRIEAENRKKVEEQQEQEIIIRLSAHIQTCWQAAKQAKIPIEERLLKCMRQRDGEYDPDIKAKLQEQANKTGAPLIYMMLTNIKCRAAKAWIKDIMLIPGERPFDVDPTPVPDLPPEIAENAKRELFTEYLRRKALDMGVLPEQVTPEMINPDELMQGGKELYDELLSMLKEVADDEAERLANEIDDDLKEGGWYEALENTIDDIVDFPAGFIAGPILRKKKKLEWQTNPNGKSFPAIVNKIVREWDNVSPFDLYPSPGARTLQDGYLIHINRFSPTDLNALKEIPGFSKEAIEHVLAEYPGGHRMHLTFEQERARLEDRDYDRNDPVARYDTIKYIGRAQGNLLLEWGLKTDQITNPADDYEIIAYMIGGTVISARLNPHPLGKRRYYSASFAGKHDSIFGGKGVPQLMIDTASICNSCARAIVRNMGVASGPQVWALTDRIPGNVDVTEMHPWKLWQFTSKKVGASGAEIPMGFFQPNPIVEVLIKLYDYFYKQASEVTGVPGYGYGQEQMTGAGKTSSGLAMLMNAASKGLKEVAKHIDGGIIKPTVYEDWLHIMLTEPEKAGGDAEIIARASEYLIQQEQLAIRRMEWLEATNNPTDLQIMGLEGRAEVLREGARSLKMPVDKVVPSKDDINQMRISNEIRSFVLALSEAMGIPVEELMNMAAAAEQEGAGTGNVKRLPEIDAAGQQMAGRDQALFNQ